LRPEYEDRHIVSYFHEYVPPDALWVEIDREPDARLPMETLKII
jgi:hypothetical protein